MAEQIISASGTQYGMIVNDDGSINIGSMVGNIVIGSVSAHVDSIYIQSGANITGSVFIMDGIPTSSIYANPSMSIIYSGNAIGSVYKFIGTGSYVKVLGYDGNNLTNVSSWQVI